MISEKPADTNRISEILGTGSFRVQAKIKFVGIDELRLPVKKVLGINLISIHAEFCSLQSNLEYRRNKKENYASLKVLNCDIFVGEFSFKNSS